MWTTDQSNTYQKYFLMKCFYYLLITYLFIISLECQGGIDCQTCTTQQDCASCSSLNSSSYIFLSTTSQCIKCSQHLVGCLDCLNTQACSVCDGESNYEIHQSGSLCQCRQNYIQTEVSQGCVSCNQHILNCAKCTNSSLCIECESGYFTDQTNAECLNCNSFITGCAECQNGTVCLSCDEGRELLEDGSQCITSNQSDINQCQEEQFINPINSQCQNCSQVMQGCLQCFNSTICRKCQTDNHYQLDQLSQLCICSLGYILSANTECIMCSDAVSNCVDCFNFTDCKICRDGYTLVLNSLNNQICQPCNQTIFGCLTCANSTLCLSCDASKNYSLSGIVCDCPYFYFLNYLNECSPCSQWSPYCETCTNHTCLRCSLDRTVNKSGGCSPLCNIAICISCYNETVCALCGPYSSISQDKQQCKCYDGFYLGSNECKQCRQRTNNCLLCSQNGVCTSCESGYTLDQQSRQCTASEVILKITQITLCILMIILMF